MRTPRVEGYSYAPEHTIYAYESICMLRGNKTFLCVTGAYLRTYILSVMAVNMYVGMCHFLHSLNDAYSHIYFHRRLHKLTHMSVDKYLNRLKKRVKAMQCRFDSHTHIHVYIPASLYNRMCICIWRLTTLSCYFIVQALFYCYCYCCFCCCCYYSCICS